MNKENAIEVRHLSKWFRVSKDSAHTIKDFLVRRHTKRQKHVVLDDVSLDIKKGDTVGLIGTNGSGKSTLLKLMTGIYYPNKGTVEHDGKLTSMLELGAGFHPDFTGRENIYFNAAVFGLTEKQIDERVDQIIEFSELGDAINDPVRTYSSGMYMRLAFSVAINVDADILLIDEILAVGDQHFQEKCYAKLRELKESDKTIVIVSHSLDVVRDLCNRAVWLYHGHFKMDGDTDDVVNAYLKQIELDNQQNMKNAEAAGNAVYKAELCIDTPPSLRHYSKEKAKKVLIRGWRITDCVKSKLVLEINGKPVKEPIEFSPRPDVFETYREDYSGFLKPEELGWTAVVDINQYVDEKGYAYVACKIEDEKGNTITERNVTLIVDEEAV